jgi:hypothetical protein
VFIPNSLGEMTSGTPCQRREREGEGTVSRGRVNGPQAASVVGLKLSPRPFLLSPFLFSFLFWFYLKTFPNETLFNPNNF